METRLLEGMPRIAALVLITILSSIGTKAFAEDFSAENEDGVTFYYNYINGGGEVEVTSGEGKYSGDIIIPETVTYEGETMKVTGIGEKAFNGCVELTSVTIPNGVTYIGEWAFYYCKKLSTVTIPNSVTSIGKIAFADCKSLSSVTIPSSVTEIGGQAFRNCTSLTSVAIPNGVTSIEYMTFMECTSLASVDIPESVQKIDNEAFSCTNLASITIPGNVQEIGNEAFKGCHNLTTITSLMKEPCKLGSSVFSGNTLYKGTLYVPNGTVNKYKVTEGWKEFSHIEESDGSSEDKDEGKDDEDEDDDSSYSDFSVQNADGVTFYYNYINGGGEVEVTSGEGKYSGDIIIPETVTYEGETMKVTGIGEKAFNGCRELTSVTIPNGVTYIGEWAFFYCLELTSVTVPNGVIAIGACAFSACKSLSSITIPSSVTEIGGQAFRGCTSLTSVAIPNGVTSIEYCAFIECTSLTSVEIPESVQKIGNEAFSCTNLASVTIPGNVQEIGNEAFKDCHNLTTVTSLMKEPCKLGSSVFSGNTLYKGTLYVPNGTVNKYKVTDGWKEFSNIEASDGSGDDTSVSNIAAENEDGVTIYYSYINGGGEVEVTSGEEKYSGDIIIPETVTYEGKTMKVTGIGEWAFMDCKNLSAVTIPNGVTSIGEGAFGDCSGLTSVTIPSSVTNIGKYAFAACTSLSKVTLHIQEPFAINSNVFDSIVETSATLFVPKGTKWKYAVAEGWREFKNVEELSDESSDDKDTSDSDITIENKDGVSINFNFNYGDDDEAKDVNVAKGDYSGDVTIPETIEYGGKILRVTSIGEGAFNGCSGLTSVTIPSSVTSIGNNAFAGCEGLTAITIPESVTSIGEKAFSECTNLKKVVINNIFAWCGISFGSIESNPLYHAGHLYSDENTEIKDLTIPNTVKSIGKYAFLGCTGLTSATIGSNMKSDGDSDGVTSIGLGAFYGCNNLKSVTIPSSVTSIDEWAFGDCNKLDSVTSYIQNPFAISGSVFSWDTQYYGTLYVPEGTAEKYKAAEGWMEFSHIDDGTSVGIEDITGEKVTIRANGGALHIDGVKDGTRVVVYSMTGAMIGSGNVTGGTATIPTSLRRGEIAIVRIGDTVVKVMMR